MKPIFGIPAAALGLAVGALVISAPSYAVDPNYTPGMDDWMIPPCERPISVAYPKRPPECQNGRFVPRTVQTQAVPDATQPPGAAQPGDAAQAAPAPQPIQIATDAKPKVIKLMRIRTSIREGDRVGEIRVGAFCNNAVPMNMSSRFEQILLAPLIRPLRDEFTRAGYADPIGQRGLFEEEADQSRVDYQLGAMVEDINVSYCSSGTGASTRIDGRIRVKVRWQLFDPSARRIMITKVTEGFYQTSGSELLRESEFFDRAYRQTVRSMLADQKFYDIAIDNASVPETAAGAAIPRTPAASTLALKRVAPFTGSLTNNMTNVRAAVVTIAQGGGTGSGFFIGEDGYVVTNSHVVAGNRFVRVKLATGRELVGEVVKQDVGRDVALIKTEGNKFVALPVSPGEGNVGGEVTAIGSPLGEALSGTVTRGIISAYRVIDGKRYIQSDVSILPGNSGGPLLDGNGRVIGIAVMMRTGAAGRVNFFVPIQEALDKLELRIRD